MSSSAADSSSTGRVQQEQQVQAAWKQFWIPFLLQVVTGVPLITATTKRGIVDLELARTRDRTQDIFEAWSSSSTSTISASSLLLPAVNIVQDFWFIVAYYHILNVLLTAWVPQQRIGHYFLSSQRRREELLQQRQQQQRQTHGATTNANRTTTSSPPFIQRTCQIGSVCALVAGMLDGIENAALLWQIGFGPSDNFATAAYWAATIKFRLLVLPILVITGAFGLGRFHNHQRHQHHQ